jgi:hypothetical protein
LLSAPLITQLLSVNAHKAAAHAKAMAIQSLDPLDSERVFAAVGQFQIDTLAFAQRRGVQDANATPREVARQHITELRRVTFLTGSRVNDGRRKSPKVVPFKSPAMAVANRSQLSRLSRRLLGRFNQQVFSRHGAPQA